MSEWIVWVPSALLALVVVALVVAVVRLRARLVALEQAVNAPLVARETLPAGGFETVASATSRRDGPDGPPQDTFSTSDEAAYLITEASVPEPAPPDRRIEGSLFADLVLRESVVKGASFVHGVRRALAPETRNRIRFQMRQEVKRSRKQRRADVRAAKRHQADPQREDAA